MFVHCRPSTGMHMHTGERKRDRDMFLEHLISNEQELQLAKISKDNQDLLFHKKIHF